MGLHRADKKSVDSTCKSRYRYSDAKRDFSRTTLNKFRSKYINDGTYRRSIVIQSTTILANEILSYTGTIFPSAVPVFREFYFRRGDRHGRTMGHEIPSRDLLDTRTKRKILIGTAITVDGETKRSGSRLRSFATEYEAIEWSIAFAFCDTDRSFESRIEELFVHVQILPRAESNAKLFPPVRILG